MYLIKKHIPLVFTKQLGSFVIKKDFLHRLIYKRVDKAIAISTVIKNNLIDTTPLTEDKIVTIPNAVEISEFNPVKYDKKKIREENGIKENIFVFTNVARLSPGKGQDTILKAVSLIKDQLKDTLFVFAGESEKSEKFYEYDLKKFVDENGLQDLVRFLGFRKDVANVLALSDAFLFPSYAEAFGISLVEAMAMGLPNIVCKADGVMDIILEDETSLTFQRDDIAKLCENILKIRSDENLRQKLSRNSIERAREFSFEKYNEKVINLYDKLLNTKN